MSKFIFRGTLVTSSAVKTLSADILEADNVDERVASGRPSKK